MYVWIEDNIVRYIVRSGNVRDMFTEEIASKFTYFEQDDPYLYVEDAYDPITDTFIHTHLKEVEAGL